jgi:hypothetical protein
MVLRQPAPRADLTFPTRFELEFDSDAHDLQLSWLNDGVFN